MQKLNLDIRDVFKGPRTGLALQKTWISFIGLSCGYSLYVLFTYISIILSGTQLETAWTQFGLFPCSFALQTNLPWYSWISAAIGMLSLFFFIISTHTAISRAVYMNIKENHFFTWQQAIAFSRKKTLHAFITPISILMFALLIIFGFYLLGLFGKIPVIGSISISLFSLVWFIGALFILFFLIVAALSVFIAPPILAVTEDDTFEAVFQSFALLTFKPVELLLSILLSAILAILATVLLAIFFHLTLYVMNSLFVAFMGTSFEALASTGTALAQQWTAILHSHIEIFFTNILHFTHYPPLLSTSSKIMSLSVHTSSILYAFFILCISGWIIAFGFSSFSASLTYTFIFLKIKKDNDNLILEKENEQENDEYLQKDGDETE